MPKPSHSGILSPMPRSAGFARCYEPIPNRTMNNTQDPKNPSPQTSRCRPLFYLALMLLVTGSFSACAVKRTHGGPSGQIMTVRTTAYHHSEPGGRVNGVGGRLAPRHSAASDWSWLPVGTRFRILETGEDYII